MNARNEMRRSKKQLTWINLLLQRRFFAHYVKHAEPWALSWIWMDSPFNNPFKGPFAQTQSQTWITMFNFCSFSISFPLCLLEIFGVVKRMNSWTHRGFFHRGETLLCVLACNPFKGSTDTEANGGQMHVCRLIVDLALQCLSEMFKNLAWVVWMYLNLSCITEVLKLVKLHWIWTRLDVDLNIDFHGGFYGIIMLSYRGIYHPYHLNVIGIYMPTVYSWHH